MAPKRKGKAPRTGQSPNEPVPYTTTPPITPEDRVKEGGKNKTLAPNAEAKRKPNPPKTQTPPQAQTQTKTQTQPPAQKCCCSGTSPNCILNQDYGNASITTAYTSSPKTFYQIPFLVEEDEKLWVRKLDGSLERLALGEIVDGWLPGHWAYTCGGEPYFVCDEKGKKRRN